VALTGGIATGKSHCLKKFAELGAPTIDADLLARQAVAPGTAGFAAVVSRFGAGVVTADGNLDRAALGALVFTDPIARRSLEEIVHPTVYAAIERWFESLARREDAVAGIADIPLLYETGRDREFDVVIVVACAPETQIQRLKERGGLTDPVEEAVMLRIKAQIPIEQKVKRADFVINTDGSFADTDSRIEEVWRAITRAATRQQ
jgi:dephospho-CoA kinase